MSQLIIPGGGGSGGSGTGWKGEVDRFSALPPATDHTGEVWLVREPEGSGTSRKPSGLYLSNGSAWFKIGVRSVMDSEDVEYPLSFPAGSSILVYPKHGSYFEVRDFSNFNIFNYTVDQASGDDSSVTGPLKTIQEAIGRAPAFSIVNIYISGDYVLNDYVQINNRVVSIRINGRFEFGTRRAGFSQYLYHFRMVGHASVSLFVEYGGYIVTPSGRIYDPYMFVVKSDTQKAFVTIRLNTYEDPPMVLGERIYVVGPAGGDKMGHFQLSILGRGDKDILIGKAGTVHGGFIADMNTAVFIYDYNGGLVYSDSTPASVEELVRGVVRDGSGTPRNIISNVVL